MLLSVLTCLRAASTVVEFAMLGIWGAGSDTSAMTREIFFDR